MNFLRRSFTRQMQALANTDANYQNRSSSLVRTLCILPPAGERNYTQCLILFRRFEIFQATMWLKFSLGDWPVAAVYRLPLRAAPLICERRRARSCACLGNSPRLGAASFRDHRRCRRRRENLVLPSGQQTHTCGHVEGNAGTRGSASTLGQVFRLVWRF